MPDLVTQVGVLVSLPVHSRPVADTMSDVALSEGTVERRHYRKSIPDTHRQSLDTRLMWLWNQRFGTVQMIAMESDDTLDKTACTIVLQAIMAGDLNSIALLFKRLEGGPLIDDEVLERANLRV
jgi:hypothetical protein